MVGRRRQHGQRRRRQRSVGSRVVVQRRRRGVVDAQVVRGAALGSWRLRQRLVASVAVGGRHHWIHKIQRLGTLLVLVVVVAVVVLDVLMGTLQTSHGRRGGQGHETGDRGQRVGGRGGLVIVCWRLLVVLELILVVEDCCRHQAASSWEKGWGGEVWGRLGGA